MVKQPKVRLTLYVMGTGPRSVRAIVNTRALCEQHLQGRYGFEVVDIALQPQQARRQQLVAIPTLIVHDADGPRRYVGDMSDAGRFLSSLGVPASDSGPAAHV